MENRNSVRREETTQIRLSLMLTMLLAALGNFHYFSRTIGWPQSTTGQDEAGEVS